MRSIRLPPIAGRHSQSRWSGDLARLRFCAFLVARAVQRRENVFGEFPGFIERGFGKAIAEPGINSILAVKIHPCFMNHRKKKVGNGRAIGHWSLRRETAL